MVLTSTTSIGKAAMQHQFHDKSFADRIEKGSSTLQLILPKGLWRSGVFFFFWVKNLFSFKDKMNHIGKKLVFLGQKLVLSFKN